MTIFWLPKNRLSMKSIYRAVTDFSIRFPRNQKFLYPDPVSRSVFDSTLALMTNLIENINKLQCAPVWCTCMDLSQSVNQSPL